MKRKTLLFLLLALAAVPLAIWAQTGGDYDLSWNTVSGGGGTVSGGDYQMFGSLAPVAGGVASGGEYTLAGGFLGGGQVAAPAPTTTPGPTTDRLFLPLVSRNRSR